MRGMGALQRLQRDVGGWLGAVVATVAGGGGGARRRGSRLAGPLEGVGQRLGPLLIRREWRRIGQGRCHWPQREVARGGRARAAGLSGLRSGSSCANIARNSSDLGVVCGSANAAANEVPCASASGALGDGSVGRGGSLPSWGQCWAARSAEAAWAARMARAAARPRHSPVKTAAGVLSSASSESVGRAAPTPRCVDARPAPAATAPSESRGATPCRPSPPGSRRARAARTAPRHRMARRDRRASAVSAVRLHRLRQPCRLRRAASAASAVAAVAAGAAERAVRGLPSPPARCRREAGAASRA